MGSVRISRNNYNFLTRQVGEAGLGPTILYLEQDKSSPYWGLMVMEELPDGGFSDEFTSSNVTKEDMAALGFLLGKLHTLPTTEAGKAADLAKTLLMEQGMEQGVVEELQQSAGGYLIFLIYWWKTLFPLWMAKNSPTNHPLPMAYVDRFLNIILKVGRVKPRTEVMSRLGFSHADAWHGNLMRKGERIVAIDCETASIGPAFLDFGGILWNGLSVNGGQPHLDRCLREELVLSFYRTIGEKCEKMEDVLYDLELGSIYRQLWVILCIQFGLVSKPLDTVEKIGGLFMEKTELMVSGMERAVDDEEVMKDIVEKGIYWTVRHQLSEGSEECLKKHVSIIYCKTANGLSLVFR